MYRRELKKLHDTKSGQAAGTTHESKWQYFTSMSFVNAVMIPRPTLSNVPAAEESVLESTRNFEDGIASTNVPINPLNAELNPICYLLALLGAHHFLHVIRIRVKLLTFRGLMSYIYGAPILDVSRSHTTTQHSR